LALDVALTNVVFLTVLGAVALAYSTFFTGVAMVLGTKAPVTCPFKAGLCDFLTDLGFLASFFAFA
jgi:hypothetical protein